MADRAREVVGVEESLFGEPPHVDALGGVEGSRSLPADGDEVSQAQLREVLGDPGSVDPQVVGELVDRVLPVEECPDDLEPRAVGEELQRLDGELELLVRWILSHYLRSHAAKRRAGERSPGKASGRISQCRRAMVQSVLVVDALFSLPRLAGIYDALDPDRTDLDPYLDMADELGASTVLDLGCGTGTFACLLAQRGKLVIGVDPAAASLEVARRKPGAENVRWVLGDAGTVSQLGVDLVTMTGNVAQVFVAEEEWRANLESIYAALRPGGRLVFESREPAREAWRDWTAERTYQKVDIPGVGGVETWIELTRVALPLVSFRASYVFASDGVTLTSHSTLRFRDRDEISESLATAAYVLEDVRDAPDRPELEMVFVASKPLRAD